MENQDKNNNHISGYIFVGCMFIGMGIGATLDKGGVGTMIGMGVGFLASAIYKGEKSK
jgi:hypothetical protein